MSSGSSPRSRRAGGRGRLTACAVIAAGLLGCAIVGASDPAPASAADPPRLIKAHRVNGVSCVPGPSNTVRARVKLWMSVVNYSGWGDWADHMEAKVRLESTEPGVNIHSNWAKSKSPYLTQDKRHLRNWNLVTDNKSGTASWRVHIQLIWHRPAPIKNVKVDLYKPFNASCATSTGGTLLPAAPALPSPGGA